MSLWIAYPGEFELYHNSRISLLRRERNSPCPAVWRMDGWYTSVLFTRYITLSEPGEVRIFTEGLPYVRLDGITLPDPSVPITVPAGAHALEIRVGCLEAPPALRTEGCVPTDRNWTVSRGFGPVMSASELSCVSSDTKPSEWRLPCVPWKIASSHPEKGGLLIDVGKEAMGRLLFTPEADGKLTLFYGESETEALAEEEAEVWESVNVTAGKPFELPDSRAMRYCLLKGVPVTDVSFLYEVLPQIKPGRFISSSNRLNAIYETAMHTMELCTREFFLDGIKRDRWVWSGDTLQSVMINHYTFFDRDTARRTLRALWGKEPFQRHINTILDYTFYWYMAIREDYLYTGDDSFIREMYPKMVESMDFCLGRRNENGYMEGQPDDWVFIDWADMPKDGELCAEQQLLSRALEIMAEAAHLVGDPRETEYSELACETKKKLLRDFRDPDTGVLCHSRKDGKLLPLVTRYPALFALQHGLLPETEAVDMARKVLLSDKVQKITTPYMHFYELDALCRIGLTEEVIRETENYWGGMLDAGATSFWEDFDPDESDHYAMYGRPFGRSLCHCWGAGPLYLTGRYLLGAVPTEPGYRTYTVEPQLAGLEWIEGDVPTPLGNISVRMDKNSVTVTGCGGQGLLKLGEKSLPIAPYETVSVKLQA